jgi:hypothetical protein
VTTKNPVDEESFAEEPEAPVRKIDGPTPAPQEDETEDAFEMDLDAWLNGATLMTASVDIVQRADLLGKFEAWSRKWEALPEEDEDDASLGDNPEREALAQEGEALRKQIEKSTSTWFVRALDTEERQAVLDAFPAPAGPPKFTEPIPRLVPSPTDGQAKAYLKAATLWETKRDRFLEENKDAFERYTKDAQAIGIERIAETLSRAVIRVEVHGRVIAESSETGGPAIGFETAKRLIKQIGEPQFAKLNQAVEHATNAEPEVPAAFLPSSSGDDQI